MNKAWQRRRDDLLQRTQHQLEFRAWLGLEPIPNEQPLFRKWYGVPPQFIFDSIERWGGLTPNQYDFARRKFNDARTTGRQRYESQQAQKSQLVQRGCVWNAGRFQVTLKVLTVKFNQFGPKILGETAEGLKLWVSRPSNSNVEKGSSITMVVTVKPSTDDPTFAFGSRPSKWAII